MGIRELGRCRGDRKRVVNAENASQSERRSHESSFSSKNGKQASFVATWRRADLWGSGCPASHDDRPRGSIPRQNLQVPFFHFMPLFLVRDYSPRVCKSPRIKFFRSFVILISIRPLLGRPSEKENNKRLYCEYALLLKTRYCFRK